MRLYSQGFIFHLEEVRYQEFPEREYSVSGWCATPSLDSAAELWLEADGERSPCLVGAPRPDVALHFAHPPLRNSGFAARVKVSGPRSPLAFYAEERGGAAPLLTLHKPAEFPSNDPEADSYQDHWLRKHEKELFWPDSEIPSKMASLRETPLISVVLPVFNTDPYHLHRSVGSVLRQKYPNWELCLSDDGSSDPRTLAMLAGLGARDRRIRVNMSPRNGGISASSNEALERARGEFVVLLDHDDELHPYALLEVARELNLYPDADLIYSDEDKIDQTGKRSQPAFKPAFDEDMLLAFNYLGHLVCIRRSIALEAGGFRTIFDGAQDWDLLLRVTERTVPERVRHIPKPLYHWRLHESSTSQSLDAKPWAQLAWSGVLRSCLERRGTAGTVDNGLFLGSMRVRREMRAEGGVAVITVLNHGEQRRVFSRLRLPPKTKFYELSLSGLSPLAYGGGDDPGQRILLSLDELESSVAFFVNCPLDSMSHGALEELDAQCSRDDCGLVSGTLVNQKGEVVNGSLAALEDSLFDPSGGESLDALGYMGMFKVVRSVPWISSAFFAAPTRLLAEAGGLSALSPDSLDDLCRRLAGLCHKKGLKVLFTPYAVASARGSLRAAPSFPAVAKVPPALHANRNFLHFPDPVHVMRAGF